MAADSKARKAERLAGRALSSFRLSIAALLHANQLHAEAHDEHTAKADDHQALRRQHLQSALDQTQAIADNNAVVDKLTAIVG